MGKRKFIPAKVPFLYKGKKVIGAWSLTRKQFIKAYALLWAYTLVFFYVVIRAIICQCAYVNGHGEAILIMMVTLFTFLFTRSMKRKYERQNFVYEGEEIN